MTWLLRVFGRDNWLSPQVTRDEAFRERVLDIMERYTRELGADEGAYSRDEKTSLQPRTRSHETKPPRAGNQPALLEREYARKGALQLFAAFNLRSGEVLGVLSRRKRQVEFLKLLEAIDTKHPASIRVIRPVCDNVSAHHGKLVRAWLARPLPSELSTWPLGTCTCSICACWEPSDRLGLIG